MEKTRKIICLHFAIDDTNVFIKKRSQFSKQPKKNSAIFQKKQKNNTNKSINYLWTCSLRFDSFPFELSKNINEKCLMLHDT